jgi:hypothetical protein
MPLLNYTTSVPTSRSLSEIQSKLAKAGAHKVLVEYGRGGRVESVSFKLRTKFGELAYLLPANVPAIQAVLRKQFPRSALVQERAEAVAWRILKDWVEAQLALVETGMVAPEQVFLAYVQDPKGQTLYEVLAEKRFDGLALEDKK